MSQEVFFPRDLRFNSADMNAIFESGALEIKWTDSSKWGIGGLDCYLKILCS